MKSWFTISNKTTAPSGPVDVLLYGEIGGGWSGDGVEAKAFKEAFDAIPIGSDISLHVHSPGGSVFDGLAIYNTILARKAEVTGHVDGIAASAASFILMAASRVVMRKTSRIMIHDAQAIVVGDSADMKEMAALLDRESDSIADIYAGKTGKTRSAIRDLMKATTWMDGDKAKELGFADEVTDSAAVKNDFDLSVFRNAQGTPNKLHINGPTNADRNTPNIMNKTALIAMLKKHGVTTEENATDEQLVTLIENAITAPKTKGYEAATPPAAPAAATAPVDLTNRLTDVEAQLAAERTKRITGEVTALCAERRIESADWIAPAIANEAVIASLRKLPVVETSKPLALGAPQNKPLTLTEQCKIANQTK